jgi:hypothetical protein
VTRYFVLCERLERKLLLTTLNERESRWLEFGNTDDAQTAAMDEDARAKWDVVRVIHVDSMSTLQRQYTWKDE